jgi:hypothetical protein
MSHCTPIPENLQIVDHLIICSSDWRVWEAPPDDVQGELIYDEPTGDVLVGDIRCHRVWPAEEV